MKSSSPSELSSLVIHFLVSRPSKMGVLVLCFLVLVSIVTAETLTNKEVLRTLDATTSMVKISTEIKVTGAKGEYVYMLPNAQAERVAFIGVKAKGTKSLLSVSAPEQENEEYTSYRIDIPSEANPTLKIVVVLTDYLQPFPAAIRQNDEQLVKLVDSHYYYSKYPTTSQKTTVKLASSNVESYTRKVPHSNRGSSISFGPYKDVEAGSWSPCTIHSQNHEPFAKLNSVQTDIEVSHWGSVSVEEVVELAHAGAELKGGFSRFDYQMRHQENSHGFNSLLGVLPGDAQEVFYRDQIGNISSSDMRVVDNDMELEIQPRFPLFGGWKTQFYIGYRVPTQSMLSVDSETGRFRLSFDFYTVFEDVWVEEMELKLVLPEGCHDINVELPNGVTSSWSRRYSYLDTRVTGGRPVLILRGKNLVSESESEVVVNYSFNSGRIFVEPSLLVAFFFCLFMLLTVVARMNAAERTAEKKAQLASTPKAAAGGAAAGGAAGGAAGSKKKK